MKKTHIIAEMAWGHDGSISQAIRLLKEAKDCGADSFCIHITDLPNYMVGYYGNGEGVVSAGRENLDVYKYLENINISNDEWLKLSAVAKEIDFDLCVMPNDIHSLEFSEKALNPEYYVVSPACFAEEDMLKAIAKTQKKTFFRIGGGYLAEIESAINIFRESGNEKIVLLHGFQNYPTKIEELDLSLLESLKNIFGIEVGLADHIDGGNPLAKVIPILSLPYGATYIEKHITLDRSKKSEDFESALNPVDFKDFVANVRSAEAAIGSASLAKMSEATKKYRNVVRKRVVASREIQQGEVISMDNLTYKRCDVGLTPDKVDCLLGRRAAKNLLEDDIVDFSNVK